MSKIQKNIMQLKTTHPGVVLCRLLDKRGLSQRDLASRIDVAHSLLNNILKGNRNINVNIAIALESVGFENANYWSTLQMNYDLELAKKDHNNIKKAKVIKEWNDIEESRIVPISYLKKQNIGINTSDDIDKIYSIYGVNNFTDLQNRVIEFNPTYFRKSSKFSESKSSIVAWSLLAKYKANEESVGPFVREKEESLLNDLKIVFYNNDNVLKETKRILNRYGVKFLPLNRPPQTPVDGKSFMSGNNPAIVLSLKYKRLDNFAFTLFHELGHVFEHLTNPDKPEYSNEEFFINSPNSELVEFEADNYARGKLINQGLWDDFVTLNESFADTVIFKFSKKHKIHPGIIRGRICFEYNEYYKKRSSITGLNKLEVDF